MIYFTSDYSQGAHPRVLDALISTNLEHTDGYGLDRHCLHAADMIRELVGDPACAVHMMVGGTPCNITLISAALRPYESVICARSGHIYSHETGAVEASGHRISAVPDVDGKLTPQAVDAVWADCQDEHTVVPRLVYISQPTEIGTVYTKAELTSLAKKCREHNLLLYADGARIGSALSSTGNDVTLKDIAALCDAFYIGGTKNGAMFGEALVIMNPQLNDHFRWMIKQQGGLLAKGRLIGIQFETLLAGGEESLFFEIAHHANEMADLLRKGLSDLHIPFYGSSLTNQVFPVLPTVCVEALEEDFAFYRWAPENEGNTVIRLVTSWGTDPDDVYAFLSAARKILSSGSAIRRGLV